MRGRVLAFDYDRREGFVSGDDGNRYRFVPSDWKAKGHPVSGQMVDFDATSDLNATSIFLLRGESQGVASEKSKVAAALLALFLGGLGIHKFYLGRTGAGVIMLLGGTIGWLLVLPGLAIYLTAFIEFILYLVTPDDEFERKYVEGKRAWF